MSNATRDENNVPGLLGVLNSDGRTLVPVKAIESSHKLMVSNGTGGTDNGPTNTPRDENDVPALMAVSSVDGKTPVSIYADSTGRLLVNTN